MDFQSNGASSFHPYASTRSTSSNVAMHLPDWDWESPWITHKSSLAHSLVKSQHNVPSFQTPAPTRRLGHMRPMETPYPPGTALRAAPQTAATIRKISDKTAFKRLLACASASARKRAQTPARPKTRSKLSQMTLAAQGLAAGPPSMPSRSPDRLARLQSVSLNLHRELNVSNSGRCYWSAN